MVDKNSDLKVGVSAIHHTSFRDIIESYVKTENIIIFSYDENYQKVLLDDNQINLDLDLIVITHLWGKFLDLEDIIKNYPNTLIPKILIDG